MLWALYLTLLIAVDLVGLVLAAFTLPGTWLILAATAVFAWVTHGWYVGWWTLAGLLGLALAGEILEFTLGGRGAKKAGASGWGIAGSLLGAVVGGFVFTPFIPIPIVGTVIGICLGSFAGAMLVELAMGRAVWHSVRIGFGAFKGRLLGIGAKFSIGLAMATLSVVAAVGVGGWRRPPSAIAPTAVAAAPARH